MDFLQAYTDPDQTTRRLVFKVTDHIFVVVKLFSSTEGKTPASVKMWDSNYTSLKRTISFWKTNMPVESDPAEIRRARELVVSLVATLVQKGI